jgi:hypothetical protein
MADDETLATKALSERATVSDGDVRTVIDMLMSIVRHPKAAFRAKTSAARVLLQYRKVNLEAIKTANACIADLVAEKIDLLEERNESSHDG